MNTVVKISTDTAGDTVLEYEQGDWHCKGWRITIGDKTGCVQSPQQVLEEVGYAITKKHFLQRLYNLFEEPCAKEMRDTKFHWSKWQMLAEVNHTFIRQIYLDKAWETSRKKSKKKA